MTHRPEQLAHEIQRAVQEVLSRGLNDPRVSGLITVTRVRVTQDLKQADIHVSILPEDRQDLTMHGLKSAERFVRREAGELVRTRQMPQFNFHLDESLKKQAAVLRELDKVRIEREQSGTPPQTEAPTEHTP